MSDRWLMAEKDGCQVSFGAKGVKDIVQITDEHVMPELRDCTFQVACDVTNPLCGGQGCSAVFGPQKGAAPDMIPQMDKWLSNYADLVITGEGRLDGQTIMGKAPIGVAKLAKKHGKKVIAFSGCVTEDAVKCNECGIDAFFPILREVVSLQEAMDGKCAENNLTQTVEQVFRVIRLYEK